MTGADPSSPSTEPTERVLSAVLTDEERRLAEIGSLTRAGEVAS